MGTPVDETGAVKMTRSRISMIVFFLVAFAIPWTATIAARRMHIAFPEGEPFFMVAGAFCSLGGVIAIYVEHGRPGLNVPGRRCVLYRVPVAWWCYALFLAPGVHVVATLVHGAAHGQVGPVRPMGLLSQWWLLYVFLFGLFQGPLAEELGWRGFLLPRLLNKYSPLGASLILGVAWAAWHADVFFSPIPTAVLFAASAVALSILMTTLFLHTRGSLLLAIVMHWSVVPGKYVARGLFPAADQPPDWLRAVVGVAAAAAVVAVTGGRLAASPPDPSGSREAPN